MAVKRWRPAAARNCCKVEGPAVIVGSLSRCRPTRSELSAKGDGGVEAAKQPSFRRLCRLDDLNRMEGDIAGSSSLYSFNMSELRSITHDFSGNFLLGEGGFGTVHKGYISYNIRPGLKDQPVAVKILNIQGAQGHREWLAEVILLGQLRHPNLVKLIGYCCEEEERLLVYEFMPRGSLENHLFRTRMTSMVLPWGTRLRIAIGAAKGLAFLHGANPPVIYRDFKASNILLDSEFTAKLSDFGLAKMGPEGEDTHVTTRVMGTQGYAAPEYVMTGHLTTKSDVYSFGVVLLELLTGRRSVDKNRPKREEKLVEWVRPYLTSSSGGGGGRARKGVKNIMDSRLAGHYSLKGAREAALLALRCISHVPKDRPRMPAIIDALEALQHLRDMAAATPTPTPINNYVASARSKRNVVFSSSATRLGLNTVPNSKHCSAST